MTARFLSSLTDDAVSLEKKEFSTLMVKRESITGLIFKGLNKV